MEATPTPTQGVQVRTAGGRVATVTLNNNGWYTFTLDDNVELAPHEGGAGESITKQRSFFAADQGELLRTVPRKEHAKKENKRKPAQDTPLRLRDKDGTIVLRTTMEVWSTSSDLDVPKGYEPHYEIEVKVQKGWTTARWSTSTGAKTIHHATVDGHKVDLDGPARTSRGDDGRHVLDIDRLKFRAKEEVRVRDRSFTYAIGTDARDDGPWKKGATRTTGVSLRRWLEADTLDEPGMKLFATKNCVGPAHATEQDRLVEGCYLARNRVANYDGRLRVTFGGRTEAEANRAAAVEAIACALDHLKGKFNDSPIFCRLSDELKEAARKARAGEPWMDQNLDRYLVRVLSDRERAALDLYQEKCRRLGRTPRVGETLVAPSEKSWDDANKREGRGRHSRVRLSVELEH